jgi:microcystin-dependent protein
MTLYKWLQTATADSTINWAEGQAPSSVNDSARAMMAATAKYRDDIAGAIVTTGTSTAYAVSSYQGFDTLAHLGGRMIAFTPHTTNGRTVTLNVDSLGGRPLRSSPNVELLPGTIIQGTPYTALYNNIDGAFYLQNFYGNPYSVQLAAGMDYWATTAPNSSFAFPIGQAISRTTYTALFALTGTTYGAGDGSTTFNLPGKRGRVSAAADPTGGLLTSFSMSPNGNTLGAIGGTQQSQLSTANLPPYTPAGSVSGTAIASALSVNVGTSSVAYSPSGASQPIPLSASFSGSFAGAAQVGTSAPFTNMSPSIICNYITRVI